MSLEQCLPELIEKGEITPDQAERMGNLYRELEADLSTKFGKQAAAAMASEEALNRLGAEAQQAKRQALLQVSAQQNALRLTETYRGKSKADAFAAMLAHDDRAPYGNAEILQQVIQTQAYGMMEGVLDRFSRNLAGRVRNRAELHNVVREAFGEETGDLAAKELAKAWGDTAEMLRTRFNAAGGGIGKLEKWGFPQVHNGEALLAKGYPAWRDFILARLDREKMLDTITGMKMTPQGMEGALRSAYDTITSDGWATRKPGSSVGVVGKTANRHADPRFFAFRDADSWMEYSREFGRPQSTTATMIDPDGPIFDAMMGHLSTMSRDIALMETLGPNPAATVRWMTDILQKDNMTDPKRTRFSEGKARRGSNLVNDLFAELSGTGHAPIATRLGTWFGAARSLQTAAKLGSATVSATTDIGFQAVTRRFNGLPVTGALNGYMRQFNPLSSADRALAARVGFGAQAAAHSAVAQSRFVGEVLTGEVASRLAEGVLRLSGLSAWTEAGKAAFGRDFLSHVTSESVKKWSGLGSGFRNALSRYGFDERSWEILRATPIEEIGGAHWIIPSNIQNRDIRERLLGMILSETRYAVPEADLRTRAMFNQHLPPKGTIMGEIIRTPLQFKSFGVSMLLTHGRRAMQAQAYHKLTYAAGLAISTTLMGALVMQMKSLLRGQDPVPMADEKHGTDPTFWAQAMAQGGGFGLAGDFFTSATDRYQGSVDEYLGGPVYGDLKQLGRTGWHTAYGKEGQAGRDLVRMIKSDLPGSSLWYAKLAFQRTMLDQMQMQLDPDYFDSFSRMENAARQQGTDYWWRPGEAAPDRKPELSNVRNERPASLH